MANISTAYEQKNIFLGPAVVSLGASGTTPSEIGGIMEVSMDIGLDIVQVEQGFPRVIMSQFVRRKTVTCSFKSVESADYATLKYALGSANYTTPSANLHQIDFGEQSTMSECAIRLLIINPAGYTEDISLWRCQGGAEGVKRDFADEDVHQPNYTFTVMRATLDWGGTALAEESRLFRAIMDKRT